MSDDFLDFGIEFISIKHDDVAHPKQRIFTSAPSLITWNLLDLEEQG